MRAPLVCCIGTTEPWNVAGLGLDLRALAACGARAVSVVAGVSAQDGRGSNLAHAIPPDVIAAQIAALERAPLAAIRIGALLDAASVVLIARALADRRARGRAVPVVYDPVLASSAGGAFASTTTCDAIGRELLPLVTVVTPNLGEAARLLANDALRPPGPALDADATPEAMAIWARALVARGAASALVTGGHLTGDPIDVFVDALGETRFTASRIAGELRGTGCLLACALAAELGRGATARDAIASARAFVRERFVTAIDVGEMRAAY